MIRHLITSEYPPQPGGVSDYTRVLAEGLAGAGDQVHVWCPPADGAAPKIEGVSVHRACGAFTFADLHCVGRLLEEFPAPRRLLVQWVPHGYGYRSMNLIFCLWLWLRSVRHRDEIELMVHEPYLNFGEGSWTQNLVAAVHRLMTIVLLRSAKRTWVSIPAWEAHWRPYTLGRAVEFKWLPVGSTIPIADRADEAQLIRARYLTKGEVLVGHFGAYDDKSATLLSKSISALMNDGTNSSLVLLGHGSSKMRATLVGEQPWLADRVQASGSLEAEQLSLHLSACDLMLQPYIDGVSSRRTSTMTALAHGVPVVTTSGGLTESFWTENGAVALAAAGNISELVSVAQRLTSDAEARGRLSRAGKAFYDEHFDRPQIISRLREV